MTDNKEDSRLKTRLKAIALVVVLITVGVGIYKWEQKRTHDENFRAMFGISVPQSKLDREKAMRVVQKKLAQLERLALLPVHENPPDSATLVATNAALERWLTAQKLAMAEKLTEGDQIDEALSRAGESLKKTEAFIRALPGSGEASAQILKRIQNERSLKPPTSNGR